MAIGFWRRPVDRGPGARQFGGEQSADAQQAGVEMERIAVDCPGNRYGRNGHARIDHEWIIVLRKPEEVSP